MSDHKHVVYGSSPFVQSLLPKNWNKLQRVGIMMILIGGKCVYFQDTFSICTLSTTTGKWSAQVQSFNECMKYLR